MEIMILDAEAIGRKIYDMRRARHLSVAHITELLDLCSEQIIYKWQRGTQCCR